MRKALYRKNRPCCLADVIGEEQVTKPLGEALKSGKFSHAYLFTGPRGCGKTSVARIFAHEVNHFNYEIEDEYIDIIEIDAASNTGVDNIRDLREKACVVPSEGKYKIYIIDEVHMLSKSAFNALLKTLEEPPEHVIFIMATTDPEKVPVTILSRAQVYQFRLVEPEIMAAHLAKVAKSEKIDIDEEALKIIVSRGGGSFRDSLSLLDQISTLSDKKIDAKMVEQALGLPTGGVIENLLKAYRASDLSTASDCLKNYYSTGGKASVLAEELISAILRAPDSAFYHLLNELTNVRDPFSEAKLLLCFMPKTIERPSVITSAIEKPAAPASSPKAESITQEERLVPQAENQVSAAEEPTIPAKKPNAPTTQTVAPAQFDWQGYIDRVDQDSARLRILLTQSRHFFDGTTLTIVPGNHQAAKAFARASDAEILRKNLPDYRLQIAEYGEKLPEPTQKDATLSKISDIMGNIQEVNSQNGGDPF